MCRAAAALDPVWWRTAQGCAPPAAEVIAPPGRCSTLLRLGPVAFAEAGAEQDAGAPSADNAVPGADSALAAPEPQPPDERDALATLTGVGLWGRLQGRAGRARREYRVFVDTADGGSTSGDVYLQLFGCCPPPFRAPLFRAGGVRHIGRVRRRTHLMPEGPPTRRFTYVATQAVLVFSVGHGHFELPPSRARAA